jgi:hypothetical protein
LPRGPRNCPTISSGCHDLVAMVRAQNAKGVYPMATCITSTRRHVHHELIIYRQEWPRACTFPCRQECTRVCHFAVCANCFGNSFGCRSSKKDTMAYFRNKSGELVQAHLQLRWACVAALARGTSIHSAAADAGS